MLKSKREEKVRTKTGTRKKGKKTEGRKRRGKPLLEIERDQGGNEVRKEFADAIASSAETCYKCEDAEEELRRR